MTESILTELRDGIRDCDHKNRLFGGNFASSCFECERLSAAVDEIEKMRNLISELLPFMLEDVRQGMYLGEPPFDVNHCDNEESLCPDCEWYTQSVLWKRRIDAGEFKDYE